MADPKPDRRDVDKAEETPCGLIVAGSNAAGVFQLVETPFDQVASLVELAVDPDAHFE